MSPTETGEGVKREIQVEIPAEEVTRTRESLIQKYQKTARLPGFRRGHAPASIIRQRFAEDIKTEVVELLVPRFFRREAEKQGLMPVSQPRVSDLHIQEGEPLRFKAHFEVLPEIKIEGYKDLRVERTEVTIADEEVDQALNNLREQHATFTSVEDRPLADGDFAQVALDGMPKQDEGTPAAQASSVTPGSNSVHMDDVLVEIGGKNAMPEFTHNLRGVSSGEEKSFDVTYPEGHSDQRLAGKTLTYRVKVQSIKQKSLPELNDDFARELGPEFTSLEEVKKRVRESIEAEKRHHAEHEAKEKLIAELLKRHDFPVPEALVEHQIDVRLERGLRILAAQGMRREDMKGKVDLNRLRTGQREQALNEVRASLLLDKIADAEKIEVSDGEIDHEIEVLAKESKQAPEAIRARLTRNGALDRIRNRIRNEKTLNFLYHQSA